MELGVPEIDFSIIEESGNKYERLTVLGYAGKSDKGAILWKCKCDCGNIVIVRRSSVKKHHTKSCGKCLHSKNKPFTPLKGECFGLLEVIEDFKYTYEDGAVRHSVKCLCHGCNNEVTFYNATRSSMSQRYSCGCSNRRHGINKTHGESKTPFYNIYRGIKTRCNVPSNTSYENYGGRGIKCLWDTYEAFREDMYESYCNHIEKYGKENTSIDRIDVNGDYRKENCRWATNSEQSNNTRRNKYITYNGETHTIAEWEKLYDIHRGTLWNRLNVLNMDIETALKYKK